MLEQKPMADSDNHLNIYREKRNFNRTNEPAGIPQGKLFKGIFVIQKHAASALHYDFRFELGGVLKSWAVPKGPSVNPEVKRLAVMTEDHPVEYSEFEGTIPDGEYGAGKVIVWDNGTYTNKSVKNGKSLELNKALKKGHITIELNGKKLKGEYTLIRTGGIEVKSRWLMIKKKDSYAALDEPTIEHPQSIVSGLTIEQIK